MIQGLRSRNAFKLITKSKTIFGTRKPLLLAIGEAIDEAHAESGKFAQGRILIKIRLCCQAWFNGNQLKVAYKSHKYRPGGTGSHRYDGITTLAAEIDHLLTNEYREQYNYFKKLMGEEDQRIGNRSAKNLSSEEYIAEFLDPLHRSKASVLYLQYKEWDNPVAMSFQQWLGDRTIKSSDDAQKFIKLMWPDQNTGEAKQVLYLDNTARKDYRLEMRGGLYYRPIDMGAPFHTANHTTGPGQSGWAIFVMSPSGYFYAHSKDVGKFHHSSFLSGKPSLAAGCLAVNNGKIVGQNNASGHYKPGSDQSLQFVREVFEDMKGALGEDQAKKYMRKDLKVSESFATNGFNGPYYTGKHYMDTNGQPTTQSSAPQTPI